MPKKKKVEREYCSICGNVYASVEKGTVIRHVCLVQSESGVHHHLHASKVEDPGSHICELVMGLLVEQKQLDVFLEYAKVFKEMREKFPVYCEDCEHKSFYRGTMEDCDCLSIDNIIEKITPMAKKREYRQTAAEKNKNNRCESYSARVVDNPSVRSYSDTKKLEWWKRIYNSIVNRRVY